MISSLELHDSNGGAALRIHTAANADAELEVWATSRHLRPFEKLVRKTVKLEVAHERRGVKRPTTGPDHRSSSGGGSLAGSRTVPLDDARGKPLDVARGRPLK